MKPSRTLQMLNCLKTITAFLALTLAVSGCQKISAPASLMSRTADASAIGGNGEPILGEGFVGLTARCTPLVHESATYVDVILQETEEAKQALIYIGLGSDMQMVDPFPITREDTATTRVYTAGYFKLTIHLDGTTVGGQYPATLEMTLNNVAQTKEFYCGVVP